MPCVVAWPFRPDAQKRNSTAIRATLRPVEIRAATRGDLEAIVRIYNYAVLNTVATFDLEPFTFEERLAWFSQFDAAHPLLVCELDAAVRGFGYYLPYRQKPAYAHTKELTVYVDPNAHRGGIGTALYERLIEAAREAGVHVLLGVLGGENPASRALHMKFGFEEVAHLPAVGRKFDAWVDTTFFLKIL